MPVFGTFKPELAKLPKVKAPAVDKIEIESAQTLTFTFEVLSKEAIAALPACYHPPFPTYCTLAVRKHDDGPYGAFTVAELRLHARAGSHYVGLVLGAFCDNDKAAAWLANAYGAPIETAQVSLTKRHFGYEARVARDSRTILEALEEMPGFISGSDVLYVQNHNLANLDGEAIVIAEEFEYAIKEARRGSARFAALDLAAFGAPTLKLSNHLPSTWTAGTWAYMPVRFLMDPTKPAMAGTRRIDQPAAA
ncbi:MAG TPA: hypothetical protein VFE03_13905 [Caulobacteraceae bacterium]|nr:hypothetical protein [Caulobacteraceae bacterium]